LSETLTICPQCSADLESFHLLEQITEQKEVSSFPSKIPFFMGIFFLLFLILVLFVFYLHQKISLLSSQIATQQQVSVQVLKQVSEYHIRDKKQLDSLDKKLSSLIKIKTVTKKPKIKKQSKYRSYYSNKQETLWDIAKNVYGKGYLYPILIEINDNLTVHNHFLYGEIRILKDPNDALKIYQQNTLNKNHITYYLYKVLAKDNWKSIAQRFYANKKKVNKFVSTHHHKILTKGERIRIAL